MSRFFEAVFMLSGMIIGVGMFGIPFSFAQAGFWLGSFELVLLTGLLLLMHSLYAEIILATPALHRFPGYIGAHLGRRFRALAVASALFSVVGTLVAYILMGSGFLGVIVRSQAPSFTDFSSAVIVVLLGSIVTVLSLRKEAFINGGLTMVLIGLIVFLIVFLAPSVSQKNLLEFHPERAFVPYGILLFALSGGVVIPEVVTILGRNRRAIHAATALGTVIPAVLYFLFTFVVVGTLGSSVSPDAISGLAGRFGQTIVVIGSMIGFLAVFTSYASLGENFNAMMRLDFHFPRRAAWATASFLPFFFYLLGFQNFIVLIGAVGAIAGGIEAALLVTAYHKIKKGIGAPISPLSYAWKIAVIVLVISGIGAELYQIFKAHI